jgi:hypothetical protein
MTPKEKLYHVTYKTREYAKRQDEMNNYDDEDENNNLKETGTFITASY